MVLDAASDCPGVDRFTVLNVTLSLVQNVPNDAAETMTDGPHCFCIAETDDEAAEDSLKMTVFGSGSRLCSLAEQASQEGVSFCTARRVVLSGAFIGAGADSHPGSQLRCRRERGGGGADLGQDLLCG